MEGFKAVYGSVVMQKGWCPDCKGFAFVIDGILQCCEDRWDRRSWGFQQVCESAGSPKKSKARPGLPKPERLRILADQNNRCFYCQGEFGSVDHQHRKLFLLEITWDAASKIAACQICSKFKRSAEGTLEEIRRHVDEKRKANGYS